MFCTDNLKSHLLRASSGVLMSSDLSDLERSILRIILNDSHRPPAITRILKNQHVECNQNQVVQALNALEKMDLVERFTSKAWLAKDKAADYLD